MGIFNRFYLISFITVTAFCVLSRADPYVYYPLSPSALYQNYMRVSLASGQKKFYNDVSGYGAAGSYNGAYGIAFDQSETFAFVTAVSSKKLRKLRLSDEYVGSDITCKYTYY
jgi:hypothetical protein